MKIKEVSEIFGVQLGLAPGNVPVYSSDYESVDESKLPTRHTFRHYLDGIYMGYKWQCVEFARRWLYINKGHIFMDIAVAYDIFELTSVRVVKTNELLPLNSFLNGSKKAPETGCLLIWSEGGEFEGTGHVAIVTQVLPNKIRIAEQNYKHQRWKEGQNFSRELNYKIDSNGRHWIECASSDENLLGWVIQTGDSSHAVSHEKKLPQLLKIISRKVKDEGQAKQSWLNIANPDEAAYVAAYGSEINDRDIDPYIYYCVSQTAYQEIKRATNELHGMFMHATDFILENDHLLSKFCLPKELWTKIRSSWNNRKNEMITGRFDLAVSPQGIKVYEYNADSASCYLECGKIQHKWSKHFNCQDGICAGINLHKKLVEAWEDSDVSGTLHIMQDDDHEETYHALFMKASIEESGIKCKVIKGTTGLSFAQDGSILDQDGEIIKWIWKTWAWETALDQLREESHTQVDKSKAPRLVDVLLNDQVLVFEPLWTLIPSNKAILPILSDLYPNSPYLLKSSFELTDEYKKSGYVEKPIVGRCGANIKIFNPDDTLLEQTSGRFKNRHSIFQELFKLQKVDEHYVQINTFTVSGIFAGMNIRIDPSLIVVSASDMPTLRIIEDNQFK